jgi:GT2 family glycosyltransferase
MESELRVSVIIPTYETRELTLRCLAALERCDPQPEELIIVDNGSTDNTIHSVLNRYPGHVVVRLPKNEGFSAAANHGIARASGDLLFLLNSDTEPETSAIGAVQEAFHRDPQLGVAGAVLRHTDGTPQWSGGNRPTWLWYFALASGMPALLGRLPFWRRIRPPSGSTGSSVDWVAGAAMVIRRQVWDQVGPFDLGFRFYCQDLDLCAKASEQGWNIAVLPDFRVLHHLGATISDSPGAVGAAHPELMWTDLLRFAGKHPEGESVRSASTALRVGGRLRLFGRQLVSPVVSTTDRARWHDATASYAEALRSLERTEQHLENSGARSSPMDTDHATIRRGA